MKYLKLVPLFPLFALPAQAQLPPEQEVSPSIQPILPPEQEIEEVTPLPPLPEDIPPPKLEPIDLPPSALPIPDEIIVRKFEVVGNTVFSQAEIDEVLKPYTTRPLSFNELLEVQAELTNLYVKNGYINSGAFIPPQDIEDRVITIQVVEGIVEDIEVTGLGRLNTAYVRSRLELATDRPLNRDKLLQALQLLRLDPLIGNVSAELSAGVHPASSILEVNVQEADPFSALISYDNYRVPSIGTDRRQVQLTHKNLLGFGDRANVAYINTDGSDSLSNVSYSVPINARNGKITLAYNYSESEIIEEPFDSLNIESESSHYEISYRQPIYQTPNKEIALGIAFTRDDAKTPPLVLDIPGQERQIIPLSRGANEAGEINVSAIRLFQEYVNRSESQVLALRSEFSFGLDVFDATSNSGGEPDSKFLTWQGQAQYFKVLSDDISLLFKADLQLSDQPLVGLEKFRLGGALSVRGYRQDTLLADNGFFASTELRTTIINIPQWNANLQLVPFVDFGTVWNTDNIRFENNTLVSVGAGLRLNVSNFLSARIDWGIPLVDIENQGNSLQEDGIYFSIQLKPF